MNIAFFGTSDRSKPILEALDENFDLKLCVTKTDRKVGRHQKTEETLVKSWAKERGINFFEIENIQGDEKDLLDTLIRQKIDLIVVTDFGFIIPKSIIKRFKNEIINIHFSLLPKYRGANPVQAAILRGDKETGITYLLMSEDLDEGPILKQILCRLTGKETSGILYERLFELAAKHLPQVIKEYAADKIQPQKQDHEKAIIHHSPSHPNSTYIYKEDAEINWNESVEQIERKIRAFNPWPIAWTTLNALENNKKLEEENLNIRENIDKSLRIKIFETETTPKKRLSPKKVQVAGKKATTWENFKNGYTVNSQNS